MWPLLRDSEIPTEKGARFATSLSVTAPEEFILCPLPHSMLATESSVDIKRKITGRTASDINGADIILK